MGFRLVCLDAGFTILSPRRTLADALSSVLAADGHEVSEDEMRAAWEDADRWFWDQYHRPGNDTWTDDGRIEEYWRDYHRHMLGRLGMDARREVLDRILASQFAADAWEPYPDVEPALMELARARVPAYAFTHGTGAVACDALDRAGLRTYLRGVHSTEQIGVFKPPARAYHWACRQVDAPADWVGLLAAHSWDVHGAVRAGLVGGLATRLEGAVPAVVVAPHVVGVGLDEVVDELLALPA